MIVIHRKRIINVRACNKVMATCWLNNQGYIVHSLRIVQSLVYPNKLYEASVSKR